LGIVVISVLICVFDFDLDFDFDFVSGIETGIGLVSGIVV
jgi:hypothetical protein